jgi:hypothetical protein
VDPPLIRAPTQSFTRRARRPGKGATSCAWGCWLHTVDARLLVGAPAPYGPDR